MKESGMQVMIISGSSAVTGSAPREGFRAGLALSVHGSTSASPVSLGGCRFLPYQSVWSGSRAPAGHVSSQHLAQALPLVEKRLRNHLSFVLSAEHPHEQGLLSIRMCLLQRRAPIIQTCQSKGTIPEVLSAGGIQVLGGFSSGHSIWLPH